MAKTVTVSYNSEGNARTALSNACKKFVYNKPIGWIRGSTIILNTSIVSRRELMNFLLEQNGALYLK